MPDSVVMNELNQEKWKLLENTYLSLNRNEPGTLCTFVYSLGVRVAQTDLWLWDLATLCLRKNLFSKGIMQTNH